jgi:hypothetical protein
MKDLGFFPNWSMHHPRSLELAAKISEIAPGDLTRRSSFVRFRGGRDCHQAGAPVPQGERRGIPLQGDLAQGRLPRHHDGRALVTGLPSFKAPFEPLPVGFFHVKNTQQDPEGAADAIEQMIEAEGPDLVAAVILEPVQNAGGCLVRRRTTGRGCARSATATACCSSLTP